jgi:hypothetical protein
MEAVAASADGRTIAFEAPLGSQLTPGGFAIVATEPPALAQVTGAAIGVRDVVGRRTNVLEGAATILGDPIGGFGDLPISPAPPEAIAAWAAGELDPDGLDIGTLVHAPDVRARLDARGLARHTFLCGQSGSGKTYTTGVLLEQVIRGTGLRLVVIDPNSDHVGLREVRDGVEAGTAEAHHARTGSLQILRAEADLPFATARIGMRFSNFGDAAQRLVLRLDQIADSDEVEALLDVTESLSAPYDPADVAAAALASGTAEGHRLAVRIRALGVDGWHLWQRDPDQPVLGDLWQSGNGIVVDTGSVADPAERSALAAGVLSAVWAQRSARIPTLVVLDEAHHICPAEPADPIQAVATEHAVLIAGEGRKYGIFLLVATQRPQKVHPSVVAGCESLVLLRMNSLRDVSELEAAFSHVPEGLLRLAPGFVRGEALVAGALAPAPLHLHVGGRITPEGGGDLPSTWAQPTRA